MAKIAEIFNGEQDRAFDLMREPSGIFLQLKLHDCKSRGHSRILRITISDILYQIWKKMTPKEKKSLCEEFDKIKYSDRKTA